MRFRSRQVTRQGCARPCALGQRLNRSVTFIELIHAGAFVLQHRIRVSIGFLEPNHGDIRIRGKSVLGVPPNLRPVNLIFQHLSLFPMMNVNENIAFGLKRRKLHHADIKIKVASILESVGLPEYGQKKINQLSGGQKQRVAIARVTHRMHIGTRTGWFAQLDGFGVGRQAFQLHQGHIAL